MNHVAGWQGHPNRLQGSSALSPQEDTLFVGLKSAQRGQDKRCDIQWQDREKERLNSTEKRQIITSARKGARGRGRHPLGDNARQAPRMSVLAMAQSAKRSRHSGPHKGNDDATTTSHMTATNGPRVQLSGSKKTDVRKRQVACKAREDIQLQMRHQWRLLLRLTMAKCTALRGGRSTDIAVGRIAANHWPIELFASNEQ